MNYLIVKSIIGRVLYFEAAFMLLPCVTALIYQEYSGWSFVFTALLCILIGAVLTLSLIHIYYLQSFHKMQCRFSRIFLLHAS